jgi:CTP:molybdopterin cytidylyltransferase MocA
MTAAIVLAAGHADRMGSNKLVLPLGAGTVIGRVVLTALAACDRVVVVIGLHDQETRTAAEQAAHSAGAEQRVKVVEAVTYDPGMFISIQEGLRHTKDADAVLIFPGDIPLVLPDTARAVRDAALRSKVGVAVPACGGRRGHPVAIDARHIAELLSMSEHATLREFMAGLSSPAEVVAVEDTGMLLDMDTPEEYETVRRRFDSAALSAREV